MGSKITLDPIDFYLMDTFVLFVVQEERKSYRFEMEWWRVHDDKYFIFQV